MKIVLFIALIAVALASVVPTSDGRIKFDLDIHKNSPIGIVLQGEVNPRDDTQNKIGAFIKLASEYIPILQGIADKENSLQYDRVWEINFMGVNLELVLHFDLIIGWTAQPGTAAANFYEVTYTPYVWGSVFGRANGTTWPVVGFTRGGVQYVHAYTPIAVTLYREGKF